MLNNKLIIQTTLSKHILFCSDFVVFSVYPTTVDNREKKAQPREQ